MKVFLINGGQKFAHSGARYNLTLHEAAEEKLDELGHAVQATHIETGYTTANEVQKYLWADVIIYQMPGWWMGAPWMVKKYLDEVLTAGQGSLYVSDGRSQVNPDKNYGTGGLLHGRSYMLSVTWNAPRAAFDEPDEFFEGRGVDAVYFPFHKSQQFLGMAGLSTFMANDVSKSPDIERDVAAYQAHLEQVLGREKGRDDAAGERVIVDA